MGLLKVGIWAGCRPTFCVCCARIENLKTFTDRSLSTSCNHSVQAWHTNSRSTHRYVVRRANHYDDICHSNGRQQAQLHRKSTVKKKGRKSTKFEVIFFFTIALDWLVNLLFL